MLGTTGMLSPAEEAALQAAQLAKVGGGAPAPAQAPTFESVEAQGSPGGLPGAVPVGGMAVNLAEGESIKEHTDPFDVTTTKTPTLSPQAEAAKAESESAQKAYAEAAAMKVPVEAVEPMMLPEEFEELKAKTQALDYGQFKDIHAKYKAGQEESANRLTLQRQAELEQQRQQSLAEAFKRNDQLYDDVAKRATERELGAKPGLFQQIMLAIANGFSTYAHIRMGHSGPSPVQQMLDAEANREAAERKAQMEVDLERAKRSSRDPAQVLKMYEDMERAAKEKAIVLQKIVADQAEKLGNVFPQQKRAADMEAATARKIAADKQMELLVAHTTGAQDKVKHGEQEKTITKSGVEEKGGARLPPTPAQVDEYVNAKINAEHAKRLRQLAKDGHLPTPEQLDEMMSNETKIVSQTAKEEDKPTETIWGDIFRGVGALPSSVYPKSMTDENKEAARLLVELGHTVFVKRFTPGSLQIPSAYIHGMAPIIGQRGDSPKMIAQKADDLAELVEAKFQEMERISKPGVQEQKIGGVVTPEKMRLYGQPSGQPAGQPFAVRTEWRNLDSQQRADVLKAVKVQGDPKAPPAAKRAATRLLEQYKAKGEK